MIADDNKKRIDDSWKEQVSREKSQQKEQGSFTPPEPDFSFFLTTLALQASIALGQVPNPATQKTEKDLQQAQFLIDTLDMLREKTKGNLTQEENQLLESVLYELKMRYVENTKEDTP